jgi:3-phenylpropionate/cinnamic acid dioxygenase small subunit
MIESASARVSSAEPIYAEIVDFLYEEAALLDDGHFEAWLDLMTEDLTYRMPVRITTQGDDEPDDSDETQIFLDTLSSLQLRVKRLRTGRAWAEVPRSRTRHLVSNVRVRRTANPDEFAVTSCILVYRNRGSAPTGDVLAGERRDLLRRVDGGLRLARRTILLDQAVLGTRHLGIFF